MKFVELLHNKALVAGIIAWALAQIIKIPLDYLRSRRWNWALLFTTGGMPSSHSALMTGTVFAIGLYNGFDHPLFALGVAITRSPKAASSAPPPMAGPFTTQITGLPTSSIPEKAA